MNNKETLRKIMKKKLDNQTQIERRNNSTVIQRRLFVQKEFLTSKRLMLYVSKGTGEVETGPIIKKALLMGKEVVLPITLVREKRIKPVCLRNLKQGFKKGPYGIFEPKESESEKPISLKDIDLVIVPGLAFDRENNRLGHGKGYYDNFLKSLSAETPKIGLGFRFQLLERIPTTRHDIPLTKVITN
jgi:5-formyltetrahydrofolate cyclo-ligase